MRINPKMSILFYVWIAKKDASGKAPIYCRVTIEGKRVQFSINQKLQLKLWSQELEAPKGNSEEAVEIRTAINNIKSELQRIYTHQSVLHKDCSSKTITDIYRNGSCENDAVLKASGKTLGNAFDYHNEKFKSLVEKGRRSKATLKRMEITKNKVEAFLLKEFKKPDILLTAIRPAFASNFEHFLETTQNLGQNISMKYTKILKQVLKLAVHEEWIQTNPIAGFKCVYEDPKRQSLSMQELKNIMGKQISISRLCEVRDVYVFCCFTGFAYREVFDLKPEHIIHGIDGKKWLSIDRHKTGENETVPILPDAMEILQKYADHPYCLNAGKLLPVNSNQRFNAYLKELGDVCGLSKNLTTHTARHTFATTVALENGVPIETVSKMLAHRSIRTTQIYARVSKSKISFDMSRLEEVLTRMSNQEISKTAN